MEEQKLVEKYKDIPDTEFVPLECVNEKFLGLYEINKLGQVKTISSGRIRDKFNKTKEGYPYVTLSSTDRTKKSIARLHVLLARTFLPNPKNLPQVNHIDGNKLNYQLSNLEWCTAKENMLHARRTGLHTSDGDKQITQIKDGMVIATYRSASEASRQTGINRANISNAARGYVNKKGIHTFTAGGFQWRYTNE